MTMILCAGEALIDMIPAPVDGDRTAFVPHAGGAVFNTAVALGRLGHDVGLLTGLSRDLFGRQLADALADSRVDMRHVIHSDRPSTLAFVTLVDGHARYDFFDENSAGRMIVPDDLPDLSEEIGALFLGGISLVAEPAADTYAALCLREQGRRVIMMDPNIRPGLVANQPRYRDRLARMLAACDIVKVSDEDLDWLVPGDGDLANKARRVQSGGPAVVVVTRGRDGAMAVLPGGDTVAVPARLGPVADTVGAGDSFNAGVLASLSRAGRLTRDALARLDADAARAALHAGAAVAGVTVSRAGANPPWAHEVSLDPAPAG